MWAIFAHLRLIWGELSTPNKREKQTNKKLKGTSPQSMTFLQIKEFIDVPCQSGVGAQYSRTGPNRRGNVKHMQTCTE